MDEIAFLSRKILDLNKQLIESEKAKSRFLSLIASELNNPMTTLLGMIPHLAPPRGDSHEAIFELIHEEALLLDSRIQNLLAASEIEGGKLHITYALIDPKVLLEEAMKGFKYRIKAKNITITVESSLRDPIVSDPKKLYLILKNVLANACDYGIANGVVSVNIAQSGSFIIVAIKNQGYKPNVEYKTQLFTRFAHGPEGAHGLGLGLSIARELCELLDGSIDYDADDTTVTFTIILPFNTMPPDSKAFGSNEFLFEPFDDAIEL
ncbi:MAG: HAMP domain-containing sensor histidine kinase [Campylobacterales bacterium]|nr:HAMP domain-containing sensor histidine kinase [Campylobacterales bacterium]